MQPKTKEDPDERVLTLAENCLQKIQDVIVTPDETLSLLFHPNDVPVMRQLFTVFISYMKYGPKNKSLEQYSFDELKDEYTRRVNELLHTHR